VAAAIAVLLVLLDLARPAFGPALKPVQWAVGLGAVALVARWRSRRGEPLAAAWPYVALAAFLLPTYVDHSRSLDADGIHYYAYLRSVVFDGDLDLRNDYGLLGYDQGHKNVLPIGAPILWSPLVLAVDWAAQVARLGGAPAPNGTEPPYTAAVALATFIYGACGLFVLLGTLRRFAPPGAAFWATVLAWVGSPLRFYLSVLPSFAHGSEFFAAALVLRSALALRDEPSPRRALLAGAAAGLVFLVRSQDGLLLGLPLLLLAPRLLRGEHVPTAARVVLGFLVAALPQLVVWQVMYGTPILVPHKVIHGDAFMHVAEPRLLDMLISPQGGLFATYPVQLLALIGLFALARRDKLYVLATLPILIAAWYLNATIFDWYQVRRFTGVIPLLAPGLAIALGPLARAGFPALAIFSFAVLRYDIAVDALRERPGQAAPVRAVIAEAGDGLAADAYGAFEPRFPRAAVALLGAYTGDALLREPATRIDLGAPTSLLRLPRPARHLSAPAQEAERACRWVEGDVQATLFLPLAWNGETSVAVEALPLETAEPISLEVLLNEQSLGRARLEPGWQSYRFSAGAGVARLGTNTLVLRFDRAPVFRRVRGVGPRQIRPAALASLTLQRAPR